jgi:1,2-diacylglycerol 3-alpha-glucosyltransferase
MRIVFVTNNYTPYSGGVVSSINATTQELQKQGHEVFIITLDFVSDHSHDPAYVIRVPCFFRFTYKKNYMAIPWRPTRVIMQLLQELAPDIVHVHHPFLLGVSALKAARTLSLPCLFTYHTIYEQYAHYMPLPCFITRIFIRYFVLKFCRAVDGIVVPSSAIKQYLIEQKVTCPITIIPSAVRSFFLSSPIKQRSADKQFFDLLVVSRFVKEKNIPFVFDVFKQLSSVFRLTLVGYGTDYEKMQKLAFDQLKLPADRVMFVHQPTQADLVALYHNADLFIFPSQTDTQGLVIAEAFSQGLPVVALDGPGQRDSIRNGYNGFIVDDAEHMIQAIIILCQDHDLYARCVNGARETARHYSPDYLVNRLLDFYATMRKK